MPTKTSKDPYGKPGKGNYDQAWRLAAQLPCKVCGSNQKSLKVEDNMVTVTCGNVKNGCRVELPD